MKPTKKRSKATDGPWERYVKEAAKRFAKLPEGVAVLRDTTAIRQQRGKK